jgi:hypothetical protein
VKNIIIKKRIEPYILLETFKSNFSIQDITFDGLSKGISKSKMFSLLEKSENKAYGLYMKNVNKFYIFSSDETITVDKILRCVGLNQEDIEYINDAETALNYVDLAKAEAAILL